MVITARSTRARGALPLLPFFGLVALVAIVGSSVTDTGPGSWYDTLALPAWQPPSWVFGPVWTVLYAAIAVAGWLWWREGTVARTAMVWWSAQLALNLAWTIVFFGLERPGWAAATIALLDLAIVGCILVGWEIRRAASALLLPYLAWTAYATALTVAIALAN